MDELNFKFLTVRIQELDSACYGVCPLFDTSNVRRATKSVPGAMHPWITLTLSSDVCVSVHCTLWEQCIFFKGRRQNSFHFLASWSPLGISILLTNDWAFLNVGILEYLYTCIWVCTHKGTFNHVSCTAEKARGSYKLLDILSYRIMVTLSSILFNSTWSQ